MARSVIPSDVDFAVTGYFDAGSLTGELSINVLPGTGINGDYRLHLVLVEDGLYYMGSNGYPDHNNVMRDMIPDQNGSTMNLSAGEWTNVDLAFAVPDPIVAQNARLIMFVQNYASKEVLGAYMVPVLSILADCTNDLGDLIDYGNITVQDLVLLVGIIMNTVEDQEYCTYRAADFNEDGNINIQDVVMLVETIIG